MLRVLAEKNQKYQRRYQRIIFGNFPQKSKGLPIETRLKSIGILSNTDSNKLEE
jgi:hypothetical protein